MDLTWVIVATGVAAVVAVLVAAYRLARWMLWAARRFGHLVDDLAGAPVRPGAPARPSLIERVAVMERRTAELRPNGGSSVKDAIDRIDQRTERLGQRLDAVERVVAPDQPRGGH